jgi:hypothetical protein
VVVVGHEQAIGREETREEARSPEDVVRLVRRALMGLMAAAPGGEDCATVFLAVHLRAAGGRCGHTEDT